MPFEIPLNITSAFSDNLDKRKKKIVRCVSFKNLYTYKMINRSIKSLHNSSFNNYVIFRYKLHITSTHDNMLFLIKINSKISANFNSRQTYDLLGLKYGLKNWVISTRVQWIWPERQVVWWFVLLDIKIINSYIN